MPKTDYISQNDAEFSAQLITFKNTIGDYSGLLALDPAAVAGQAADADYFTYCLQLQELMRNASQQASTWKSLIRNGGTPPASGEKGMRLTPSLRQTCASSSSKRRLLRLKLFWIVW